MKGKRPPILTHRGFDRRLAAMVLIAFAAHFVLIVALFLAGKLELRPQVDVEAYTVEVIDGGQLGGHLPAGLPDLRGGTPGRKSANRGSERERPVEQKPPVLPQPALRVAGAHEPETRPESGRTNPEPGAAPPEPEPVAPARQEPPAPPVPEDPPRLATRQAEPETGENLIVAATPTPTPAPRPTAPRAPQPTATRAPQPTATRAPQPTVARTPQPTALRTPQPTPLRTAQATPVSTARPSSTPPARSKAVATPRATIKPAARAAPVPTPTASRRPGVKPSPGRGPKPGPTPSAVVDGRGSAAKRLAVRTSPSPSGGARSLAARTPAATAGSGDEQIAAALARVQSRLGTSPEPGDAGQPPSGREQGETGRETAAGTVAGGLAGGGVGGGDAPDPGRAIGIGGGVGGAGKLRGVEFLLYYNRMLERVRAAWVWAGGGSGLELKVRFAVLDDGSISEPRITEGSGDASYDASVLRALRAVSPLDPPPAAHRADFADVELTFRPSDLQATP